MIIVQLLICAIQFLVQVVVFVVSKIWTIFYFGLPIWVCILVHKGVVYYVGEDSFLPMFLGGASCIFTFACLLYRDIYLYEKELDDWARKREYRG